jgi:NADPH-dependent 2,4-dienoyl-CoA reductase/sulfur reductase-like enzyme/peroxiredoxin family protein/rhodanese-related sulfurtransferase/TusA-related sulfurtransferase
MSKILIVGGVAGGMSAAARLRRNSEDAEIIVFEKGGYISYANCGLPYYIGGTISERQKLLVQTVKSFSKRFNVDIRVKNEVVDIDTQKKMVKVKDLVKNTEYTENYDKLILSVGAVPFVPNIPGVESEKIFTLRTIEDSDRIKEFIEKNEPRRALIVGAGYIGLELAENLHNRRIFVSIVELADQVMAPLDFEMAAIVHNHLKNKGIEFYLGNSVASFSESESKVNVELKDGKRFSVDMVILSIGVKPDISLAKKAGLKIGSKGGILVNEYLQTSDPDVYAIGDVIEVRNGITGQNSLIPLAGPANKQGRIVADNIIFGNLEKYTNTFGNAIAKVFDLTVAVTGANEKTLKAENIPYLYTIIHPSSHATYYPSALQMSLKVLFSPENGKILGAQCVGYDGVDKRIDVITAIMQKGGTVCDLKEFEHSYAPPYSSAKDPVNMAGFTAENILSGKVKPVYWNEIENINLNRVILLDVRTPEEFKSGTIPGAINIPVDELRQRLNELPGDKEIIVFCRVGLRGYIASRILTQSGFKDVRNLVGGYITYSLAKAKQDNPDKFDESYDTGLSPKVLNLSVSSSPRVEKITVDACGLQCPGPIMKLKNEIDRLKEGDVVEVRATDPGFYNDVLAWAKATNNEVLSLNIDKGIVVATIRKGKEKAQTETIKSFENDKTIIVFDNNLDKVIAAYIIANGALAMGRKVTMFFTFWGLSVLRKRKAGRIKKNFIEKMFGWMLPKGTKGLKLSQMNMFGAGPLLIRWLMKRKKVEALENMIEQAKRNGAKLVACQMSMDLMGIKKEELIDGVEVGGVASYLEASEHADNNLFI